MSMHLIEFLKELTNNNSLRAYKENIFSIDFFAVKEVNSALVKISIELIKNSGKFLINLLSVLQALILIP